MDAPMVLREMERGEICRCIGAKRNNQPWELFMTINEPPVCQRQHSLLHFLQVRDFFVVVHHTLKGGFTGFNAPVEIMCEPKPIRGAFALE